MATFISEGNIRIRGKRPNIIQFLQEELVPVYELQDGLTEERPIHLRRMDACSETGSGHQHVGIFQRIRPVPHRDGGYRDRDQLFRKDQYPG